MPQSRGNDLNPGIWYRFIRYLVSDVMTRLTHSANNDGTALRWEQFMFKTTIEYSVALLRLRPHTRKASPFRIIIFVSSVGMVYDCDTRHRRYSPRLRLLA